MTSAKGFRLLGLSLILLGLNHDIDRTFQATDKDFRFFVWSESTTDISGMTNNPETRERDIKAPALVAFFMKQYDNTVFLVICSKFYQKHRGSRLGSSWLR